MGSYSLAKLVKKPKGTVVELPAIQESIGSVQSFLKAEREMLRSMQQHVREVILPQAEAEMARNRSRLTQDIGEDTTSFFATYARQLAGVANGIVQRVLSLEAKRHTTQFRQAAKRALGIDLSAVVRDEDLADYLRTASTRAAGLITGLADETVKRIANSVTTAIINGVPVKTLRKTLVDDFGIADRRAQLIARDQVAKLNSDLNRERQVQAGVTEYRWLTSHDERVRSRHRALEGKVYRYGEATGAEGGLPPGQPIQCRCVARGIVRF
jgi:SPP1 gp7 family putative phage head morphogenesis protein